MKKYLSLILAVVLCLTGFCGCGKGEQNAESSEAKDVSTPSVELSYDDVSYFVPEVSDGEESDVNTSQTESQSGGFSVKMAKYDYNDELEKVSMVFWGLNYMDVSIAILDITNETNQNYSVTITGKYLDKDGKVIKTETQTWDQFEAGLQKYFLFKPCMKFDSLEYTIETEKYEGECWKNQFKVEYLNLVKVDRTCHPLYGTGDPKWVEGIGVRQRLENNTPYKIKWGYVYTVLFDSSGNVIGVYLSGNEPYGQEAGAQHDGSQFEVHWGDPETGGKIGEWPELFNGVTGITVITSVEKSDD